MNMQRRLSLLAVTAAVLALPLSNVLVSQTAIDQVYDKTKHVTVKGMLIGSAAPKPPYSVYLLISTRMPRATSSSGRLRETPSTSSTGAGTRMTPSGWERSLP